MIETKGPYPSLPKSYKGRYPFSLSTTSFIYPADYIPNVNLLGPYVDEIELLLFESNDIASLFSVSVIDELCRLASDLNIGYNIHLPTDVSLSAPDISQQRIAVDTYKNVIQRMLPLAPTTFSLHIPYNEGDREITTINTWRDRVRSNLERLLSGGLDGQAISIETLDYPLDRIEDIILDLNLSICLDVGHLILNGYNIEDLFNRFRSRISVIHLHGVENNQDHISLDRLPQHCINPIIEILKHYTGIVSLEVFSYNNLNPSLHVLEMWCRNFITTET
jgi:sugar phosphate isomerase/epimerase